MVSDAEQARADRFYDWVRSGRWDELVGKSTADVLALAGPPTEVWHLDHEGHRWLQAVYRFDAIPSAASDEERHAYAAGMQFTPTLIFRDGISVGPARFDAEVLGGRETAGPPADIVWQPGGSFP